MTTPQPTLKNSKRALVAKCLPCLVSILSLLPAAAAHADENTHKLAYEVYAGGIHAVQTSIDITITDDRYDFVMDAKTRGFLGRLAPWEGIFESHGWVLDNGKKLQPELHKSTTSWRDELDVKEYNYNKDGTFDSLLITDTHSTRDKRDVAADLTNQTIDALTATLQVLNDYNTTKICEGQADVFDGKRRFKQHFQHTKNTTLTSSKYNIFDGEAAQCIVEVTPIAGKWHEKPRGWLSIQEQGRDRGTMPTVWIGKITKDGPAIPIKVRIKTAYGTLFMHLAEYQKDDIHLIAKKRTKQD
jgi:hypothetical protein